MTENIIYYGPPGTGKTYLLQNMMSDFIDYEVSDTQIIKAYQKETEEWILISLIMIQNRGKMKPSEIQSKIDSLHLGKRINITSILEAHSIKITLTDIFQKKPSIFFECENGYWYVNKIKIKQYSPYFFSDFLSDSKVERRYAFVTFHQSFSYEDFIEGIRPTYIKDSNSIDYSPKDGIFKEICKTASEHSEKEYAIFIDEINRGNISEIFGELITLIETDKRQGMENELSATLPYSKEVFIVPHNLCIFGTMNSADRSVGTLDIALRRRFKFIPMKPNAEIISNELFMNHINPKDIDGIDIIKLFNTINNRIELLLDSNHMLGQAMFLSVRNAHDIVQIIRDRIVPLLEEYFFNDFQKIQLVFNDLDESGELKENAIYMHNTLSVDEYFNFVGDYLLFDKKRYFINPNITANSIKHIYGE